MKKAPNSSQEPASSVAGNSADPTTQSNPTGGASASKPPAPRTPTYPTGAADKTHTTEPETKGTGRP